MALTKSLSLGRAAQLLASLLAVAMHGYLTVEIHNERLGLTKSMVILELLACILLGYSILAIILQNTGQRAKKTAWMKGFIAFDVLMCALLLGIITTLARAGLPVHCGGMTRDEFGPNEEPNYPDPGYTTIRFSDEDGGRRGELDPLCGLERSYYTIANAMIFTYMFTITVTVLRIFETKYTKNTKVNELLDSLERAEDINLKVLDPSPSLDDLSSRSHVPPASEGIITRSTSLRSNVTTTTSATHSQIGHYPAGAIPRRPIGHPSPSLSRRQLAPITPASSASAIHPSAGAPPSFVHDPLFDDAEAALVADGMQHHPPHHSPHHRQRDPSHHHPHHPSFPRMPMLSEEEQHSADAALVSDGMRPSEPTLPPYHPGDRRMSGHGGEEDNEMRLSGYVKGQTRAQAMKDSGRY